MMSGGTAGGGSGGFWGLLPDFATVAIALATLGLTVWQIIKTNVEKRPNIRAAGFKTVSPPSLGLSVTFVNPSLYAVYINACTVDPKEGPGHYRLKFLNVFIPPNGSAEADVGGFRGPREGILRVYFQYGGTGRKFHRLSLPFKTRNGFMLEEGNARITLSLSEQTVEQNVRFRPLSVALEWPDPAAEELRDQGLDRSAQD